MGDRHPPRIWPRAVQSVGQMRELGARIAAFCPICRNKFRVDLDAVIQAKGRSYSLIDQRGPCRLWGCDGRAFFMFSTGEHTPWRPLATEAGDVARMLAPDPDDEPPPCAPPPRAPAGVSPTAWAAADARERQRLIRRARG
jgi:hypothetical protein